MVRYSTAQEIKRTLAKDGGRIASIWLRIDEPGSQLLSEYRAKCNDLSASPPPVYFYLKLFHKLPISGLAFYEDVLTRYASTQSKIKLCLTGLNTKFELGKQGIGLDITSPELMDLHSALSLDFSDVQTLAKTPTFQLPAYTPKVMLRRRTASLEETERLCEGFEKEYPHGFGQATAVGLTLQVTTHLLWQQMGAGRVRSKRDFAFRSE